MVTGTDGSQALPPSGVSVALLTPVGSDGEPDLEGLDRLVARVLEGGVAGISPAGSTGEGWRLSPAQRVRVVGRVAAAAQGRPVIAGVPMRSPAEFLAEVAAVADAGADAALVPPPGPYALSDDEAVEVFSSVADRSPLPLVLYHIPALAGVGFGPGAVARLARHPRIAGLKDSNRDLEYLHTVVRRTRGEEFRVVTGADTLLAESLALGAVGAICASPNIMPALAPALFGAVGAGDSARVARLRDQLADLVGTLRAAGSPAGWKAAAGLVGACGPLTVPPGRPLAAERVRALRHELEQLRLPGLRLVDTDRVAESAGVG